MSLTLGGGPLSRDHAKTNFDVPARAAFVQPWGRRLRAVFAGQTVFDTERAVTLHVAGQFPSQWIPLDDVDRSALRERSDERGAPAWDVVVGDRVASGVVTGHRPREGAPDLSGHVTVEFGSMDRWFDEDEPVYGHLKDPYHRVDVCASSRHVVVRLGDQTIAESRRPMLLFETNVPTMYYLPFADVRLDALSLSETVSECPYKGDGQHWHLDAGGERVEDAAWSLPHPLPEGFRAAEHLCFYADKVEVTVDGQRVAS